ncbi:MAG TPA: alpha/beta fold hydrolase [Solirubrobacteraceae bacterium]|nr:alpha/beta fold hydrolase [Solirubrobacteraceae bacterium]
MADTADSRARDHAAPKDAGRGPRPGPGVQDAPDAGALDLLLTEAGRSSVARFLPGLEAVRLAAGLARRPGAVLSRSSTLVEELVRITVGRSQMGPERGDRRFQDPGWSENPIFQRLLQTYLVTGQTVNGLIDDAELEWSDDRKVRFVAGNMVDALAPTNFAWSNPEVLKRTVEAGGLNFVKGARRFARDVSRPPRLPANVNVDEFALGRNIALSPGAVVVRDERFELIQYQATRSEVREVPLLIVPPMINKFYIADLAPGRSLIEYLVSRGQQVFTISWRNPDERHRDWGLDSYAGAVIDALDAIADITDVPRAHMIGNCAGGMLASTVASHFADVGERDRLASLTLGVCVIDNERSNVVNSFATERSAKLAKLASSRKGYLDGRDLASVFLWLRPNELIWPYVVNNWLLGKDPPAFDILYWNADTTRMPAALHREFLTIATENSLREPGAVTVLGSPVVLSRITADSYLVAGIADHITPWQNCYRTTQLLGGTKRFVLSNSGHIAAIVNPPTNKRANYRTADTLTPPSAEQWLSETTLSDGTWWADWDAWLAERSGDVRPAPAQLGSGAYKVLGEAPGEYARQT